MNEPKYWAFLSYSHKDKDWGQWLHTALETYRVPRRLVGRASRDGTVPKRLYPIFRDREELPTSADLKSNISESLEQSRYLVVICSPHSANSRWVNEEIKSFKALGRENRVLALIVDGEPNASDDPSRAGSECFPPALRFRVAPDRSLTTERVEPIAADARPSGDGKVNARLKLLAGVLGVSYDELKQRERRRKFWMRVQIATATLALALLTAGVAEWGVRLARREHISHDIDAGRQDLLQGDAGQAMASLLDAYSLGGSSPALRFLLRQAGLALPLTRAAGHTAGVYFATISPDGSRVATTSIDGTAKIWDSRSGKMLHNLQHSGEVNSAYFSPDGRTVLTSSDDRTAVLWDVQSGKALTTFSGHNDKVYFAVFDPKGERVVTASEDHTAKIWSLAGVCLATLVGHTRSILSAFFSSDGRYVLTASDDGTAAVWDAASGRLLAHTQSALHSNGLRFAAFSPDDKRIVTVARDGEGWLWRFHGQRGLLDPRHDLIAPLAGHRDAARRAIFSPSGDLLVTTSKDGTARVWDGRTGKFLFPLQDSAKRLMVWTAAFRPDGRVIATADAAGAVKLWDASHGRLLYSIEHHHGSVFGLCFSTDGKLLTTAGEDRVAYVWDVSDPTAVRLVVALDGKAQPNTERRDVADDADVLSPALIRTLPGGEGYVTSAHFSPNSAHALIVAGHQAQLWDVQAAKRLTTFPVSAADAEFNRSGDRIVIGTTDGQISVWSAANFTAPLAYFTAFRGWVFSASFIPGRDQILAWGEDQSSDSSSFSNRVKFFDFSGREFRPPVDGDSPVLSSDSVHLLTLSSNSSQKFWDAGIRGVVAEPWWHELPGSDFAPSIWNLATPGAPTVVRLRGHAATVYSAVFSPDGKRALTASADGTAGLWDATSGNNLAFSARLGTDQDPVPVKFAAFSPGQSRIVTGSKDKKARLWPAPGFRTPIVLADEGQGYVISAAFSPDNALLATLASDREVRIWDAVSGALLARLSGHGGLLTSLEFSADGKLLLTGSEDHTARVWDVAYETRTPARVKAEAAQLLPSASSSPTH